ncbi:MAG: ISAs1 family transposase, partial [Proteobacteria bacterium]|nr:ISAs1 family transposase [Pseudomonadota bacterium]
AHYYFCVKKNQPTLLEDIEYHFSRHRGEPDYKDNISVAHGRIEIRRNWTTGALNDDLKFPFIAQVLQNRKGDYQ